MRKNGERIWPLGKQYLVVVGVLGLLFLVSCATQDSLESKLGYEKLHQATITESQQLKVARTDEHKNLEQKGPDPELPLEPVMPSFNPLDDVPVSITMRDQPLHPGFDSRRFVKINKGIIFHSLESQRGD